ncbi:hypothetical protein INR49_021105 [Caranx melampygus]|nr:hypothetical protein INR49_021105 [Caranx melampygus]
MATARMKLVLLWLCILHVVLASAGLFTRNDLQAAHRALSESRAQNTQSTGGYHQWPGRFSTLQRFKVRGLAYLRITVFGVARLSPDCSLLVGRLQHRDGKRTVADCGACPVGYFADNRNA